MPSPHKRQLEFVDLTEDNPIDASSTRPLPESQTDAPSSEKVEEKPIRKRKGREVASSKQQEKTKPEKRVDAAGRTVRWYSTSPIKVMERIERAMPGSRHRMFLIDRKVLAPVGSEGGGVEEFAILGATGNVYTVTICRQPRCTCPDYLKGNLCKHIFFTMLRVLRVSRNNPLVWQKALLAGEVDAVLSGERASVPAGAGDVLAAEAVRAQYRRLRGDEGDGGCSSSQADGKRKPVEGDCPICFDPLCPDATSEEDRVTFCGQGCGNNVHAGCMRRWVTQHNPPTCPLCRSPWVDGLNPVASHAAHEPSHYTNLAQYAEEYQPGDTSLEALYGDNAMWIRRPKTGRRRW